jgi:hypothetical protein
MVTDPSRLREKMYLDLTAALGVPTAYSSYVRQYCHIYIRIYNLYICPLDCM